jgi:glycosyltransferase involved in cell wall biosynthesis
MEKACRLHAVSELEASQYIGAGADPARVSTIPNGIDAQQFAVLPSGEPFRERLDLEPDQPLILYVGRLNPIKGMEFLLDGFAVLHKKLPKAVLAVVGPDDGAGKAMQHRTVELGLNEAVRFVGFISGPDKLEAFCAADAYVLPSRFDISSVALLEAMASAAPVIVSRGCALAEEVAQREVGTVVDYGDVSGLFLALDATLTHRKISRERGSRAREWVLKAFDWEAIVTSMESVYRDCVQFD